jgi:hypothetical protein
MTETSKSYTIRQYPPSQLLDNGTYSDNNLTYASSITDETDISGTQYGGGSYIVKYSSYKENNNNLIARYKFDNNATNMLLDSTENGNNLTNYGSTFDNTNYKVGDGSVYLNGNSQYISIPSTINPYTIWNNNGITFSLWSKLSTSSGLSASLLSFGDSTNKANIIEPIAKGIKQYPETPSTNTDSWTDNGYNVVCKTSDAILSPQISCYLFNNSIVSPDHYHSAQLFSSSSPYNYTGSTSFKGTNGLVIYIDLGRSITFRNMRIAPRDNAAYPTLNFLGAMPNTFKIYASNDSACWSNNNHSSWTEIHSQTTSLTYNYNQFTNFGNFSTNTTAYRYFAMVVYNLIGNYTYLTFSEWDIFGIYDITPISTNILLDRVAKNTGMSGWVQIKHLPGGPELPNNTGNGRTWFSGNTFNGSAVNSYTIGNPSNNAAEWSIPFDSANVQFYLFYENTNDFNSEWYDRWGVMRKSDMVEVNYPNWKPFYKALNYPNGKTEGLQYNRINNIENADPNFFGTVPHLKKDGTVNDIGPYIKGPYSIYIENSATGWWGAPPAEVNVFVKYTADIPSDSSNYKYLSFVHSGESETQTTYTVNFPENAECDILLVGGGGGGGQQNAGGGGAGGLVLIQNFQANGSYTINVGKGGNGGNGAINVGGNGSVGNNTTFIKSDNSVIITANGGGGGGGGGAFQPITATNGGSGGGGGWASANGTQTQKSQSQIGIISPATINQFGENGGHGGGDGNSYPGGGGGGAGGIGATSTSNTTGQNGGLGIDRVGTFIFSEKFSSSIGDSGWFAGGGGSGGDGTSDGYGNGGSTLYGGGGGNGDGIGRGINGINGTGGGGGSVRDPSTTLGGNGGSGIVLIRYKLTKTATSNSLNIIEPNIISGGTITPVTFATDYKYLTFTNKGENQTVYTVNFPENAECDILVVGGGGGGGVRDSGGGGGGGVVLRRNYTISSNTTTTIYVGKGGNYIVPGQISNNGFDSSIVIGSTTLTAIGGGGGGGNTGNLYGGKSGGSGGGGGYGTSAGTGTQPTSASGGYGNNGSNSPGGYVGGGGGGAGSAGKTDGNENIGRTGGDGIDMSAIFGTMVGDNGWFAGGGGSGGYTGGSYGNGGVNRFGGASKGETATATDAIPNTGGGGGSVQNGWNVGDRSGGGGSGVVIIRYKLSKILPTNININNLIAYYKFNDSGSLGLDSNPSSTKYNLTPTIVGGTGGYNTTTAIEGGSFQATNDGDRLEGDFPLKSIYDSSTSGISISCWYYKKLATYDNIYNTHLFHFHNPSDSSQWINMSVSHYNNIYKANISFSYTNGETYSSGWGPTQALDTWYHVVLILTKSGNIKVYLNGTNLNLSAGTTDGTIRWYNSSTYPLPQCPNTTKLKIFTNVGLGAFNGNIDEFYVFNKELTQAEVTSLYNKTIKSNSLNIIEPNITSGGTIIPVSVGIDYKYLEFSSTPDLIHNFTDFNTEATWKAKANSIPGFTYNFAVYFADGYAGLWSPENNVGYIEYQLPSSYNTLTVNFGNIYYQSEVRLLINGVVKKSATGNQGSLIHTQSYNVGDILRIEELYAIMNADLIITLTKTTPNLIYDFSSYNSEATWKAYADTIPNFTYSLNTFLTPFDNDAVWTGDRVVGWVQMTLPSTHNFLSITYGLGVQGVEEVRLLINGVEKSRATSTNRLVTYSQAYNVGDVVRIEETFSTMSANIIITLTSTNQTSYTVNFPENTQCSALIIGNPNYTYLQNLSLYGTYNIVVGNTSSITKNDNSITYNNSVTAQTVPFTNTITDSTITYNLVPKVIIRYKMTKTITSNSQDETTSDNWIAISKNSTNNDIKFEIQNSVGTGSSYTLTGYSYNNGLVTGTHEDGASTTYVNLLNLGIQLGSVLTNWSFNTKITGKSITPLILEDTGSANYVVRGIGTSRYVTTAGLNSYPFELVQGTNVFSTSNYKFGWKDGTTTTTNTGVISWSTNNAVAQTTYALSGNSSTNISLNTTYNFGNQSLGNRTYSFKLDFNSTMSIIDNTWHHIAWSISSTGVWSIYIDNQYINPNITRSLFNITYARQYIGKSLFSSNGWLIGNIYDLRIYNKVLTTNEIASIYNNLSNVYPWLIFKNDPAYWSKIDISSSQPNWNGNYQLVAPYSYLDNSYLVNNFTGDYVTIKLPYKIYLTKYVICSTINKINKAPQHFSIYGSIDGINWNKIVEKHLTPTSYINTQIPNSTNSTGYYTDDETKSTVAYDYYGIVVNKLIGPLDASDNNLSFSLWNVYGTNDLKDRSYFEFGLVTDTSKTIGSSLKDGLIKANNSNIFIKSGNTNTPALTIGTNNKVAVGKNIASEAFDVSGSLIANEYRIKNQNYPIIDASSNIVASGNTDISGNLTLNNNKFVVNASSGNLSVAGTLDISKNININNGKTIIDSNGNIKTQGNFDLSSNININNYVLVDASGSVIMNNTLDISNNATLKSNLDIKGNIKSSAFTTNSSINKVSIHNTSVDPSYNFHVSGSTRLEGNLDVDGNIIIVDTVQQTSEQFIINNDGDMVALTVKQIGAQPIVDLRDDGKSVFYLADNGLLGLGTTTPSCTVDVSGSCYVQQTLDVSGNLNIGGNTYLSENIQFNDILDVSQNVNINNKFFMDPSGNVDICGNMLIYGYLISNGNNANSGGFQQDGNAIINGELRVLYNIDISQNLRVLDTFIVDASGNIKSKGQFDLSNNLRNGSNYSINTVGNVYSAGNIDISKNFNINNGVFSADVSGNIIVNGFIDISKNFYVNGNKFTIDQSGNITAMGTFDISNNLTINTNKFIVDTSGNIKSVGNFDISNNFNINNGAFKIDNNGNISSQNNFDVSGNMSINGQKMTVSNTGNIKSTGTLDISNNFSINNNKFVVDSSGNTIAKGNVDISNNLTIGNNTFNVDASGNIQSSGTLDVSQNLKIGNTLLTVDHQNKRVGINTTTPEYSLDVSGQIVTNKAIMGSSYSVDTSTNTTTTNSQVNIIEPQSDWKITTFTHSGGTESQTLYNVDFPAGTECDILIVGGGGSGGIKAAGGGGAGGLIFRQNQTLDGSYTISVGNGGNAINVNNTGGLNGYNSSFGDIIALGGGGGGAYENDGKQAGSGGSGGGSFVPANVGYDIDTNSYGNNGGIGKFNYWSVPSTSWYWAAGGGGGAGSKGEDAGGGTGNADRSLSYAGNGGNGLAELNGIDFKTHFNLPTNNSIGQYISAENKVYFAGGGGGGNDVGDATAQAKIPLGGKGGGGSGINNNITNNLINALANSGGGGGSWGSGGGAVNQISGRGGSGIVIIKYRIKPVTINNDYKYFTFTNNTLVTLSSDSTNLKAWYKFDGNYNDSSSSGYHLTNNSTIIASTYNIAGQSVEFDNTDSLMFPATFNPYTIWNGNGITFSIWVRFTSITNWARLIDLQQSTSLDNGIFISIKGTPGGFESAMYIKIGSTAFNYSNWSNSLISQLNVWRHIVVSLSSSGALNVYVDNVKINSNETATIPNLTWGFRYINKSAFSVDGVFNGQMDDFRVYDKVLTSTEVSQLYNISTPTTYTVNFPTEGTECSALIVGNPNYTYLQNFSLSGTYNIVVGNTSSITKSDNSITYNNSVTTQIVPFTNTITDSTVTYNLVPKVIIRYKLTKTITSNSLNIVEPNITSGGPITPVTIGTDYKYLAFTYQASLIEQKTGVGGWRLVRFLPPTSTNWGNVNDNLVGTTTYGTAYDYTNKWSIPFGTFDEFCFGTLNLQYWLYTTKNSAIGANYSGTTRSILKSSSSSTPYTAIWYNRTGQDVDVDPWISIQNHPTQMVYGETGVYSNSYLDLISLDGGMCVWVRNSADVQPLSTPYAVNFSENTECDILVVGGGGGGGKRHGGGGGAGTMLYHKNVILNGDYNIKVGKGGTGVGAQSIESGNRTFGTNGNFSQFVKNDGTQEYYANGGGRASGWSIYAMGETNGGQSFDVDNNLTLPLTNKFNGQTVQVSNKQYVNTLTSPEGCRGNIGGFQVNNYKGGGGGGAGSVGQNHAEETTVNDGYGGLGLAVDITGTSVLYAGGGNGSDFSGTVLQVFNSLYPTIESRGGGGYGSDNGIAQNGLNGTGGGGGGQGNDTNGNPSGDGGSGIVIIRYKLTKTITSNSLNIVEPVVISETIERIYPPIRNATSNTTTITGQTYGNGVYIVSASSNHPGEEPFKIINTNNTGWTQSWTSYNGTPAGTYTGTFSLGGYSGECVKIQLPYRIKLTRHIIEASSIGGVNRAPSIYKIFGSNDDSNWVEIHHKSVALISSNYVSNKFEETISNINYYKHYALVVNKNIGLDGWLGIGEWQIYGREKITPESIDANYKYLAFTYQVPPSVVLREYPPSAMTINSTTLSVGGTDAAGNAYGAGTYTINYPYGWSDIDVYTLFNKSIGYNWIGSLGSSFNGNYIGAFCNDTRTSLGTYFGSCKGTLNDRVWTYLSSSASGISIDLTQDTNSNKYYGSTFTYSLPSPIYLQNLQLYNRSAYSTFAAQAPKSFRVYGMNIGDNGWTQIANYSNLNAWTSYTSAIASATASNIIWDGTTGAENLTFKINANTSYSMYGFVVNALLGSNENFTLAEIKLFGTDYYVPPSGQTPHTVNFPENTECDILVVGGGGAGGASVGGGGGAGGVVYQKNITLNGIYTILVGKGGDNTSSTTSTPNEDSVHNGLSSQIIYQNNILSLDGVSFEGKGGGGGGSRIGEPPGNLDGGFDGGSGGGNSVSGNGIPANPGSSTQGNTLLLNATNVNGGYNSIKTTENWVAGGGAGAGNSNSGMNGGAGIQLDITGSLQWYAAGGGAGRISTSASGIGGSGIGGSGKSNTSASNSLIVPTQVNGTNNTGSGGGGGGYYYGYITNGPDGDGGGAGGSGIVIIRYKLTKTITTNSLNIVEPRSLNVESIYPPYRYFTYNDANGIYTVQNGSIETSNSTNFSYTYSYNDPANTQGNNERTSSTFKNTYGMGLYNFSIGGTQEYGGRSSGIFIYGLSNDYDISTSGNRPAVNHDDNSALPNGGGWYVGAGWINSTTYNSSYYYNTTFQGAWIKIEMPIGIILSSFKILGGAQKYRSPKAFKIYGSNTNTTTASDWTLLHTETNYTYTAGGDFGVKQTVNNNLIFKNYLMVVSEQHTHDGGLLVFQGWYIYGKEEITPETIDADYKYLVFKNDGSNQTQYTVNFLENTECDILVVGGGGGGGASIGSGGGAGGLTYYNNVSIAIGTYTIIVGAGGTGAVNYLARGANGYNSSAFGNTSYGGGGGSGQSWVYNTSGTASGTLQTTSANQGSGAGGTRYKTIGNEGTVGQGNNGGNEVEGGNIFAAGGGGGAGGVGGNGSLISLAGVGGIGVSSTITGASIDYAGGGGGGAENLVNGSWVHSGGTATHGGGAGGDYGSNGTNGKGGGGGGGYTSGGNGGSGIVIVRYKFTKTINNDSTQIIYSNDATFGYRDTSASFIPSIVQLSTGQTYINSLSQYIHFNFGNDNKCKMDASGNLTLNGDIFIYSDGRIKENVTTITSALDKVNEMSGITYNIINKPRRQIGVIAQEVEKVLPEVIKEEDGVKTVAYPNMVGILIEALKELNDRVDQTI